MYEVAIHERGREEVTGGGVNNPCAGLLRPARSRWVRITQRPIGLARAIALANAQETHATVCGWRVADVFYDNGKAPRVPAGWWHPEAQSVFDDRRTA